MDVIIRESYEEVSALAKVHDYGRAVEDRSGFGDRLHLNRRGAELLLDQMVADGLMPGPGE